MVGKKPTEKVDIRLSVGNTFSPPKTRRNKGNATAMNTKSGVREPVARKSGDEKLRKSRLFGAEPSSASVNESARSDSSVNLLLRLRTAIVQRALALRDQFEKNNETMTLQELKVRRDVLEEVRREFSDVQTKIDSLTEAFEQSDEYVRFIDGYCELRARIISLIELKVASSQATRNDSNAPTPPVESSSHSASQNIQSVSQRAPESQPIYAASAARLPKIELPMFSGKHTEWYEFTQGFASLIHSNPNLSDVDKFLYLKSRVTGAAAQAIEAIDITANNYRIALSILKKRFDNKRLIFNSHVDELFRSPSVKKGDAVKFSQMINSFGAHYRAILSMGTESQCLDGLFINLLLSRLDPETIEKWESSLETSEFVTFDTFYTFLLQRAQMLEHLSSHSLAGSTAGPRKASALVVNPSLDSPCLICNESGHSIHSCDRFKVLEFNSRFAEARRLKLCLNCLWAGHIAKDCTSKYKCRICASSHHTLLHRGQERGSSQAATTQSGDMAAVGVRQAFSSSNDARSVEGMVFFGTAQVLVSDHSGSLIPCRVLLDSAAGPNFITKDLAYRLSLPQKLSEMRINGIGSASVNAYHSIDITIRSRTTNFSVSLSASILDRITDPLPQRSLRTDHWTIPQGIELADPQFCKTAPIDLLLGVEYFLDFLKDGQLTLGPKLPRLQNTVFGWIVMGRSENTLGSDVCAMALVSHASLEDSTEDLVRKFWEIEEVKSPLYELSRDDAFCEDLYAETTYRDASGRYVVKLPFLQSPQALGDSFQRAYRQFCSLELKLRKNPELKLQYQNFMHEFINLQHMVPVDLNSLPKLHYFMPHHAVMKPSSSTTKLRVVFNASAATSTGISLNELLASGPIVQDGLFANLLRFRLPRYTFCADITKMYRMIAVEESDSYFQLILWRDDSASQLKAFRLTRVTYGTAPAAYLATRTVRQLAIDYAERYPLGSETLLKNSYVDDALTGDDNLNRAIRRRDELMELLKLGGFELRKWYANDPKLLAGIAIEDQEQLLCVDESDVFKTLGLLWQSDSDNFRFSYRPVTSDQITTRRSILREVARIYDPLGVINPVVTKCKVFVQGLWQLKLGWDDPLPNSCIVSWLELRESLEHLRVLDIPRLVLNPFGTRSGMQIHGFADASQLAYGAALYIRTSILNGESTVRLLCAKSKVAPIKVQSTPRLELCAALLLSELLDVCLKMLNVSFDSINLWSDSTIVLAQLKQAPNTFKTFVGNRVAKIQGLTEGFTWRHVPTELNPADLNSRGITPQELSMSRLWFEGPFFLLQDESQWPKNMPSVEIEIPERRCVQLAMPVSIENDLISPDFKFLNSYSRTIRVFAYVRRFCFNTIRKSKSEPRITGILQACEFRSAEIIVIRQIQQTNFESDYSNLKNSKPTSKSSPLTCLSPFLDNFGLIRVGGRLGNSALSFDERHQILLPKRHPFTKALIINMHLKHYHLGAHSLLSIIRQRYWPLDGKATVSSTLHHCVFCKRRAARTFAPFMADLPFDRVDSGSAGAFMVIGLDYGGPFTVTFGLRGRASCKVYLVVVVCFHTKAVHLEVVTDLTSRGFLRVFKMFQAARGKPNTIFSDNATTFLGAKRIICEEFKRAVTAANDEVREQLSQEGVEWKTIPPRSPHMGGLWEAAIKQAKRHLKAAIGTEVLNIEDFRVVIKEVEAILNSRPLVSLSNDPADCMVLTPAHFLVGRPLMSLPEPCPQDESHLERYERVSTIRHEFWKKWRRDYLQSLQKRAKWTKTQPNIKIGTVVTVRDDNLPPLQWSFGLIVALHPGKDGVVRVVTVRVGKNEFKRAVHDLVPIEPSSVQRGQDVRLDNELI